MGGTPASSHAARQIETSRENAIAVWKSLLEDHQQSRDHRTGLLDADRLMLQALVSTGRADLIGPMLSSTAWPRGGGRRG